MNYMNNYSFIISSRKNKHNQKKVFKAVDLKKNEETRYKRESPPPPISHALACQKYVN